MHGGAVNNKENEIEKGIKMVGRPVLLCSLFEFPLFLSCPPFLPFLHPDISCRLPQPPHSFRVKRHIACLSVGFVLLLLYDGPVSILSATADCARGFPAPIVVVLVVIPIKKEEKTNPVPSLNQVLDGIKVLGFRSLEYCPVAVNEYRRLLGVRPIDLGEFTTTLNKIISQANMGPRISASRARSPSSFRPLGPGPRSAHCRSARPLTRG